MALSQHRRLQFCVCTNAILLVAVVLVTSLCRSNDTKDKFMRFGPQPDLLLLGIPINTWAKYYIVHVCLCCFQMLDTVIQEFTSPVLGFNIYNPDKKHIVDFTKFELQFYAQSFWLINSIKSAFLLMISITQIDLAVAKVVYMEMAGIYTIRTLINEKTFGTDLDEISALIS